MSNKLASLMLLGLLVAGCVQEESVGSPEAGEAQQSPLTLSAERNTYLPYERVVLLASWQGTGAPALAPEAGEVDVQIEAQGQTSRPFRSAAQRCLGLERRPEQNVELIDVTMDQAGWVFATPGSYTVRLRTRDGVISNPINVSVQAPSQPADVEAARAIASSPSFADFMFFDGGDRQPAELALAKRLADGTSSYRRDMRDLLVRHYSRQSVTLEGGLRAPDPTLAAAYYDRVEPGSERTISKARSLWYLRRLEAAATPAAVRDLAVELERLEASEPRFKRDLLQSRPLR